jgi:hypothetical protein
MKVGTSHEGYTGFLNQENQWEQEAPQHVLRLRDAIFWQRVSYITKGVIYQRAINHQLPWKLNNQSHPCVPIKGPPRGGAESLNASLLLIDILSH